MGELKRDKSVEFFSRAKELIPGGVNSPVRAFTSVDLDPLFIEKAEDAYIYDVDGNKYIDYVLSWGPMILGHTFPPVVKKLREALSRGTSYGAPTEQENKLAAMIIEAYPSIDRVRMVNSGTEAAMSALRLARGYTGRKKVLKMVGCYHGHNDSLLVEAGSGPATLSNPSSPGVPEALTRETITVPYNDFKAVKLAFERYGQEIAAVILEPIAGNMGVVLPREGYLEFLREITKENAALLIFDEVISGFRVAYGGAQEYYQVSPDLTCLGKIIGGGLPVGAYGGSSEIMQYIAPDGPVYQAGTLSGNPLAVTAGIATLEVLKKADTYQHLKEKTEYLVQGMKSIAEEEGLPVCFNYTTGIFSQFFTEGSVCDYDTASRADRSRFIKFFKMMLEQGIYLAPSPFESGFLSLAHGQAELDHTLAIYREVIREL
ncbi:MAG: glutamate-1-semialdehyde-2,1-aminomutase [Firmicutes bacterium]|nr:glutamate-1-semialdehyde-2,1-aminomutase [Bacillota bacterium]